MDTRRKPRSRLKDRYMARPIYLLAAGLSLAPSVLAQSAPGAAPVPPCLEELPVIGIAKVTFKVPDLDKARTYYKYVLGFAEAFDLKDSSGQVTSAFLSDRGVRSYAV
jgi:hypothetical protein